MPVWILIGVRQCVHACVCLAGQMSQSFLGKQIDGVWHTGVVAFGKEFFFGGGIQHDVPGRTPYDVPVDRISLGDSVPPTLSRLHASSCNAMDCKFYRW